MLSNKVINKIKVLSLCVVRHCMVKSFRQMFGRQTKEFYMSREKTALVVDDEDDVRILLTFFLEKEGWRVIEAEDGDHAMAKAINQHPDVIFLDVFMPDRNGFEVYKDIREDFRTAHIPVIFVTAINDMVLGQQHTPETLAASLGVPAPEAFIEKPFNTDEVLHALNMVFHH